MVLRYAGLGGAAVVVVGSGFGSFPGLLFALACGAALGLSTAAMQDGWASSRTAQGSLLLLALVLMPAVSQLRGFQLAWLVFVGGCLGPRWAVGFMAGATVTWCLAWIPDGGWLLAPLPALFAWGACVMVAAYFERKALVRYAILCTPVLIVGGEVAFVAWTPRCGHLEVHAEDLPQVGSTIGRAAQALLAFDGGRPCRVAALYASPSLPPDPDVVLAEHDLVSIPAGMPVMSAASWQQPEPWGHNQFVGDQYLLFALRRDGFYAGNLGGRLVPAGRMLLGAVDGSMPLRVEPLVQRVDHTLFLGDSDAFVDRLCVYQAHAVRELLSPGWGPRGLNLLLVLGAVAACFPASSPRRLAVAFHSLVVGSLALVAAIPAHGDVRIEGPVGWPHDPGLGGAVPRALADAGIIMWPGSHGCTVLCVGPGRTVRSRGERLVFLEPGSTVRIGEEVVRAGEIPLGAVDGIPDARQLARDGVDVGVTAEVQGIRIIGTGSPARQDHEKWLSAYSPQR